MTLPTPEILNYYREPGPLTELGEYAPLLKPLPRWVPERMAKLQGLMLHIFWAENYDFTPSEERQEELNLRTVQQKIKRILELDNQPLNIVRSVDKRLLGNCRDYSTMLVAFLRQLSLPARARCGFATYLVPDHYEDHWVVEYWDQDSQRWVTVDGQIDAYQRQILGIKWEPFNVPAGQFISGGQAWLTCRAGEANPDDFGIFDFKGLDFVRGNLLRDVLALNKVESLPWDFWGYLNQPLEQASEADLALFDQMATLTLDPDANFDALRELYANDPLVHNPAEWETSNESSQN